MKDRWRKLDVSIVHPDPGRNLRSSVHLHEVHIWSAKFTLFGIGRRRFCTADLRKICSRPLWRAYNAASKTFAADKAIKYGKNAGSNIQDLTLRSTVCNVPTQIADKDPRYPLGRPWVFGTFAPSKFAVEMIWRDWSIEILESLSFANLKFLKLPISEPSDLIQLKLSLSTMPKLESLSVTDIPDQKDFTTNLFHLGEVIIACRSTLRELSIELTYYDRLLLSDHRKEPFLEPAYIGYWFRDIFRCFLDEEFLKQSETYQGQNKTPLNLTKLHLIHVSIPSYAFKYVFNPETIEHLDLPYSQVDDAVWLDLQKATHVHSLTEIGYDMLSRSFLQFLASQTTIKELTFVQPLIYWEPGDALYLGGNRYWPLRRAHHQPRPYSYHDPGNPSLVELFSSLQNNTELSRLVLRPGMFDLASPSILSIPNSLQALEHLEFSFDYGNKVRSPEVFCIFPPVPEKTADSPFTDPPASLRQQIPPCRTAPKENHITITSP